MINICDASCGWCGRCDADPRTPCASCGALVDGVWCDDCMAQWNAQQERERQQKEKPEPEQECPF